MNGPFYLSDIDGTVNLAIYWMHTNTLEHNMKDQIAKELIRNGVPMAKKIGGDWVPAQVRHCGNLTKLNGKVVRNSLVTHARCYGLVA